MKPEPETPRRVSSDENLSGEELALRLLMFLRGMTADRRCTPQHRRQLLERVAEIRGTALAPIGFLVETLQEIVANGTVSESDLIDIYFALERVLPVTARRLSEQAGLRTFRPSAPASLIAGGERHKAETGKPSVLHTSAEPDWRDEPMTDAQLEFIKRFRGSIAPVASKSEAGNLIERLLTDQPLSSRQEMMIKFWNHKPRTGEGPREVLAWMEDFHQEDPDRRKAWRLFRREHHDDVGWTAELLPMAAGAGPAYLARVKEGAAAVSPPTRWGSEQVAAGPRSTTSRPRWHFRVLGGVLPIMVVIAILMMRESHRAGTAAPAGGSVGDSPSVTAVRRPAVSQPSGKTAGPPPVDPSSASVMALKLVGIVDGEEPRAVIDGRLYLVGDLVDIEHRIKVVWIDGAKQTVDFVDSNGRIVRRNLH